MTVQADEKGVLVYIPTEELSKDTLRRVDIEVIKKLIEFNGNLSEVCRNLGYTREAIYNRFKALGI
jgi:transcriptional regulator of acetoin/glycerol metabolism